MKKQEAKPNCSRGYSCGMSCINVKLMCRQDGLAGQFVRLAENYFQQAAAKPKALPKEAGDAPLIMHKLAEPLSEAEAEAVQQFIEKHFVYSDYTTSPAKCQMLQ